MESGTSLRVIQELLGHRSSKTTEIYTHVSSRSLQNLRNPFDDIPSQDQEFTPEGSDHQRPKPGGDFSDNLRTGFGEDFEDEWDDSFPHVDEPFDPEFIRYGE